MSLIPPNLSLTRPDPICHSASKRRKHRDVVAIKKD